MLVNLYYPIDNFHLENFHVFPALLLRFHKAKVKNVAKVVVWRGGKPLRKFLHMDALEDATVFLMDNNSKLNVGSGKEVSLRELAEFVKDVVDYKGVIFWDSSKPDDMPIKLMDNSKLAKIGWEAKISLRGGFKDIYKWHLENVVNQQWCR